MAPKVTITATDKRDMLKIRRAVLPLFKGQVVVKESKKVPPGAEEVQGRGKP